MKKLKFKRMRFGSELHGRPSFYLLVPETLPDWSFPLPGYRIVSLKTKKPTSVPYYRLLPNPDYIILNLEPNNRQVGFRGRTWWKVAQELQPDELKIWYEEWRSPRGNLGRDAGLLLSVKKETAQEGIFVEHYRTGRLYGEEPVKYYVLKADRLEERYPEFEE